MCLIYEFVRTPAQAGPPGSAGKPATPEMSARAWTPDGNLKTADIQQQRDHRKPYVLQMLLSVRILNLLQMRTATCSPYPSTDSRETSGPR